MARARRPSSRLTLVALLGLSAGCDKLLPFSAPSAGSDLAASDVAASEPGPAGERRLLEAGRPDLGRADLRRADLQGADLGTKDITPGCWVNESFTSSMGEVAPQGGSWGLSNGQLRQSSTTAHLAIAMINGVSAADYVVRVSATVNDYYWFLDWASGAYLGVRANAGSPTPASMVCGVAPTWGLIVGKCAGGSADACLIVSEDLSLSVPTKTPLQMTVKVSGGQLTCTAGSHSLVASINLAGGGPYLATANADVSFDNLSVCPQ